MLKLCNKQFYVLTSKNIFYVIVLILIITPNHFYYGFSMLNLTVFILNLKIYLISL